MGSMSRPVRHWRGRCASAWRTASSAPAACVRRTTPWRRARPGPTISSSASRARTARCRPSMPSSSGQPGGPRSSRPPASPSRRRSTPCRALPRPAPSSSPSATLSGTIRTARRRPSAPRSRRSPPRRRRADAAPAPDLRPRGGAPRRAGHRPAGRAAALGRGGPPRPGAGSRLRRLPARALSHRRPRGDEPARPRSRRRRRDDAAGRDPQPGPRHPAGSAEGGGMVSACCRPRQRSRARGARHDGDRRARHGAGPCARQGLARGRRRQGRARRVVQSRSPAAWWRRGRSAPGGGAPGGRGQGRDPRRAARPRGAVSARPRRRPGHERGGALVPAGGRERQHGRRGRVRDPALQRQRRRPRREARGALLPPRRRARQHHRPEPPGAALCRWTRRAEEPDRGGGLAPSRGRPRPHRYLARRDPQGPHGGRTRCRREARSPAGRPDLARLDRARGAWSHPPMIRSPLMTVMTDAVMKAARSLKRDFGEVENLQVSRKGPGDFVSAADHKAEKIIRDALQKARPDYGLIMEEAGVVEGPDKTHRWHIDPLDGTTNFLHGLPQFAISVGLEREGQPVAGVIYNPATDEMFIAEKGKGAYLNNRRMRVAARREMADALVISGTPHIGRGNHPQYVRELAAVMAAAGGLRRLGAAALDLAYVACGRADAYWERGLNSWDMAAGVVLLLEAGGFVSDADGGADPMAARSIACGNEALHRELVALLKAANR